LNEALELQIRINEETQHDVFTTSLLERITSKTHELQNTLGSPQYDSESEDTSIECSYNDVRQLSDKLNALNDCIDKLLIQNNTLKSELDKAKGDNRKDYQELVKEKESLERNLMEIMRSNEVLQEELNSKHLQLSAFKSRLETSLEKRREREDIEAQIEANEKNLLSYRKFIEEQTHEREMEREEYNKQLIALTERLKDKDKIEAKFKYRLTEMETRISSLTEEKSIKEKELSDVNSELNVANDEIYELKEIITQMEKESNKSNNIEKQLRNQINDLNKALESQIKINEQTQEKFDSLNDCIDKLLVQNNNFKSELAKGDKVIDRKDYQKIVKERDSLERKLLEIIRSNEVLQEELNNKHIQLNAFKSRLDASLEKYVEDDEKLQGVTNQFLWKLKRVISHKNALIYQKKYLLHVLGGFQLTERATLALLANMNVTGIQYFHNFFIKFLSIHSFIYLFLS
jgi:chromosome segregation ATPase